MRLPVIATMFAAFPGVPIVPPGPVALELPAETTMPAPPGKFAITLFAIVPFVMFAAVVADPPAVILIASPFEQNRPAARSVSEQLPLLIPLVSELPEMSRSEIVPLKFAMSIPCQTALFSTLFVIVTVPDRFRSVPEA